MNTYPTEGKYNRLSLKNETRDKSVCDGFDCLECAKNTVRVNLGEASSILLHLCNNCVKIFQTQESHSNKNVLEQQQVARLACSNTSRQNQPLQQHGVLLDG